MPIYEYKCEECGHEFEEMLHFSERDAPLNTPCEQQIEQTKHMSIKCDGEVKQVMHAPYFGYDNIHTRHSTNNKEPGWFKDKITDLKRNNPGHSM